MARTYRLTSFARFGNTMSGTMIGLGLGPAGMRLLTVPGRTSGIPRTTPVNLVTVDARRWLVAPYGPVGWVHNARVVGRVSLRRGRRSEMVAVREAGPVEAAPVLKHYLTQLRFVVGPYFDVDPGSPLSAFEAEAGLHPVFEIVAGTMT